MQASEAAASRRAFSATDTAACHDDLQRVIENEGFDEDGQPKMKLQDFKKHFKIERLLGKGVSALASYCKRRFGNL